MDQRLQELLRQFIQGRNIQSGLAFIREANRSQTPIPLEYFNNDLLKNVTDIQFTPNSLQLGGSALRQLLQNSWLPMIDAALTQNLSQVFRWIHTTGRTAQPAVDDFEVVYAVICRNEAPGYMTNNPASFYRVYLFTMLKTIQECLYCHRIGPHLCEDFEHPYAGGLELEPSRSELPPTFSEELSEKELNEIDPLLLEANEQDVPLHRTWFPETKTDRQMETVYNYSFLRWTFQTAVLVSPSTYSPSPQALTSRSGWHLVNINPCGYFTDNNDPSKIRTSLNKCISDFLLQSYQQTCLRFIDTLNQSIPTQSPHEPLEEPPTLSYGPCEDFAIIPGGQIQWELLPNGQSRIVADGTTVCGHGYLKEPAIEPLCPPMWSDGVQAGWKCNGCGKVLALEAGRARDFILCNACQLRNKLDREAEGGHHRIREATYTCPCGAEYEDFDEAVECCEEDPDEIEVTYEWGWDHN